MYVDNTNCPYAFTHSN